MDRVPYDIKGDIILRLPIKEVEALCRVNKAYYKFCNDNYGFWRRLIIRDYSAAFNGYANLQDKLEEIFRCEGKECWNYRTYVSLIKFLPDFIQAKVYLNMNDTDSFFSSSMDPETKLYAAVASGRDDLAPSIKGIDDWLFPSILLRARQFNEFINNLYKGIVNFMDIRRQNYYLSLSNEASRLGLLDVIKLIVYNYMDDVDVLMDFLISAAGGGQLDIIKFLMDEYDIDPKLNDSEALKSAAYNGEIKALKFLLDYEERTSGRFDVILIEIVDNLSGGGGSEESLKYILSRYGKRFQHFKE